MNDQTIRIGGVPEHFNLPWHVGIEDGHFARVGAEAQFEVFGGGTGAMMKAIAQEQVDLAVVLSEGCIAALTKGVQGKVLKTFVQSPLIWGIHTSGSSSIEDVQQIQGKRYAISRMGSGSHLMAIVDADLRGWPSSELEFVIVKNLDGARAALANGEADVFFWERFTTSPFVASGEFRRIDQRLTPWPAFVVCAGQRALTEKGPAIARLLNQVNKIARQLVDNQESTISTISQRYELPIDQTTQWFETLQWSTDWKMEAEGFWQAAGFLKKLNLLGPDVMSLSEKEIWQSVFLDINAD